MNSAPAALPPFTRLIHAHSALPPGLLPLPVPVQTAKPSKPEALLSTATNCQSHSHRAPLRISALRFCCHKQSLQLTLSHQTTAVGISALTSIGTFMAYLESTMSLDLATHVGALVGTSLLLFYATSPRKDIFDEGPEALRGMKRYSSYHRQRFYSLESRDSEDSTKHFSTETSRDIDEAGD